MRVSPELLARLFTMQYRDYKKRVSESAAKETPNSKPEGYVYILKMRSGLYKIGFTCDIDRRLKQLDASGDKAFIVKYVIQTAQPRQLEISLHKRFDHLRIRRELFKLTVNELEWIKEQFPFERFVRF